LVVLVAISIRPSLSILSNFFLISPLSLVLKILSNFNLFFLVLVLGLGVGLGFGLGLGLGLAIFSPHLICPFLLQS